MNFTIKTVGFLVLTAVASYVAVELLKAGVAYAKKARVAKTTETETEENPNK